MQINLKDSISSALSGLSWCEKIIISPNEEQVINDIQKSRYTNYAIAIGNQTTNRIPAPCGWNKFENNNEIYLFVNNRSITADWTQIQNICSTLENNTLNNNVYHSIIGEISTAETLNPSGTMEIRYYKIEYKSWVLIQK